MISQTLLLIKTFHEHEFYNFYKQMNIFFSKYKLKKPFYTKKHVKRKFTVLRSPHVNKTARDQIELRSTYFLFNLKKNFQILYLIFYILNKISNHYFNFTIKKLMKQQIIFSYAI